MDYLTKLIPFDPSRQLSLREYIDDEPKLTEEANKNPKIKKLLSIALKLEGLKRHASIHAAGVVISWCCHTDYNYVSDEWVSI